jgi:hypothetical protein
VNFPVALTSRTRLLLAAVAAIALFAILAGASVGSAAASGGVSAGDGDGSRTADSSASKYDRIWNDTSRADKRWAKRTAECESGGDPDAIGGGGRYRGAFQFMKATWRTSPKSPGGDPIDYTYRTQAVVAVLLKKRDGRDHWPVCG